MEWIYKDCFIRAKCLAQVHNDQPFSVPLFHLNELLESSKAAGRNGVEAAAGWQTCGQRRRGSKAMEGFVKR